MSRVIHFEIHAEQPERAIQFYTGLFGWQFTAWNGSVPYWLVTTGPIEGQPVNAYACTVDVASVDAALKTIAELGGTIALPKMAIPGVGWLAYGKDTEGNIFGVMQADPSAT